MAEQMTLHVLFGQRICDYPRQYAPETLAVMTEYEREDNPEYLQLELEKYAQTGEYSGIEIVDILVDIDPIITRLNTNMQLTGQIL